MKDRQLMVIVDCYKKHINEVGLTVYERCLNKIYHEYEITKDLDEYRYFLALCIKGQHQRRMSWSHVIKAIILLEKNFVFKKYDSFEELYNTISTIFEYGYNGEKIPFVNGRLTKYDIALHLGQVLKIYPQKIVYLADHTRKTAKYLFNEQFSYKLDIKSCHSLFGNLDSMYIEDILCIFYELFENNANDDTNLKDNNFTERDVEEFIIKKIKKNYIFFTKEDVLKKYYSENIDLRKI